MRAIGDRFIRAIHKAFSKEVRSKRFIRAIHKALFEGSQVETVHKSGS
ncbi:hypothetical protein ACFVSW_13850 [Neobacillus sp. NPDC058068]